MPTRRRCVNARRRQGLSREFRALIVPDGKNNAGGRARPKPANKRAPSRQRRSDNPLHRQPRGIIRSSGGHPFFNQGSGSGWKKMPINYGRDRDGSERGSGFVGAG